MDSNPYKKIFLDEIAADVNADCRIIFFDEIDSTNNYAKHLLAKESIDSDTPIVPNDFPLVIIADSQSAGRGRLGRSFYSPRGTGIYLSIIMKTSLDSKHLPILTMATSVGVRRAIESVCEKSPLIKWVNDLYLDNKKICGILLETATSFCGDKKSVIAGIGINCFPGAFPEELNDIAGCISDAQSSFSRSKLAAKVIEETLDIFQSLESASSESTHIKGAPFSDAVKTMLSEYKKHCFVLGRKVTVTDFSNQKGSPSSFLARALDISDNGGLIVEPLDGSPSITLFSGEVSINLN